MTVLPIVERELRVALRKHQPVRRRLRFAAACAGGALLFILLSGLIGSGTASHDLHQLLCLVGLYIVGRAPQLAAGIFAQERREQTLGLLMLSGLSAGEVFVSKLFSAAALVFADFLAVVPLMALPFLMGGISFELFVATICCLPNILLFALAASLLASVLAEDDGTAVLIATGIALVLCAAPPAVYFADGYFSGVGHPSAWWLRLSPAYGPYLGFTRRAAFFLAEFWRNFAITLAWSGVCLAAAAWLVKRLWRKRENEGPSVSWRQRWSDFVRGSNRWRRGLALRLLDRNPFTWLALRNRNPSAMAWSLMGGLLSGWVLGWFIWPDKWPSVVNFFITATLLNLTLRWIIYHTAAVGLGAARHDGSYELLLTTPLQPSDIVSGQLEALRDQFQSVSLL